MMKEEKSKSIVGDKEVLEEKDEVVSGS